MNRFSLSAADALFGRVWEWFELTILRQSTLQQGVVLLLVALAVFAVHRPLIRFVRTRIDRLRAGPLQQAVTPFARLSPWLLLLLLLWFATLAFHANDLPVDLIRLVESLAIAWVLIRLTASLVRDAALARAVAIAAWIFAAINIAGLTERVVHLLDSMALPIGSFRLSVLLILKGVLALGVYIWIANTISRIAEHRLQRTPRITPAMQVLASKLARAGLLTLAVVLALGSIGIDLTAFAVFSGAIGVGVGFGLQKVVSNLVSGVILLLDSSIKPGDVIELEGTYGWITRLNARFVSLVTRDGKEHLIPNEDLITQRVVNWSYTNDLVRLHVKIGVSYQSDLREAIRLAKQAVSTVPRALKDPAPLCLLTDFGDSSVDFELRFWIRDPRNGTANVRSDVMLNIWDLYHAHGIEFPFPQRDLHIRDTDALGRALAPCGRSAARRQLDPEDADAFDAGRP